MTRASVRERGFSLIEVLVAFSIMALALGVLYQSSAGSVRATVLAGQNTRAVLWAQSLLASRSFVPAQGWFESGETGDGFSWSVASRLLPASEAATPRIALHEIEVVVRWSDRGKAHAFRLVTVRPEEEPPRAGT